MHLAQKSIIVTGAGAGNGFGEDIAKRLAVEGAQVIVSDIDTTNGERVAAGIVAARVQASFFAAEFGPDNIRVNCINPVMNPFTGLGHCSPVGSSPKIG